MEEKKLKRKKEKAIVEENYDLLYHSCKDLADEYTLIENYELALHEYKEAAKAAHKLDNKYYIAFINRMIGETYCHLGKFDQAISHQKLHLNYARDENNLIEKQRALATLGRTYFVQAESFSDSERTERAKSLSLSHKYYSKSLSICEKLPSSNQLGQKALAEMKCKLFLNLGLTSEAEGKSVVATEYISKAIVMAKKMELWEDLYRCYTAQGSIHFRQGSTAKALEACDKGLQVAERCEKKTQFLCELLSLKADVLIMLCDYNGAKNVLIKAYKIKSPDPKDREDIEKKLKTVFLIWQKEQQLLNLSQSDYTSRKEVNEKLGDLCVRLKSYDKAIQHYLSTLECAKFMGLEEKCLAPIYYSLAQTYKDNKQYELSVEYSRKEYDLIKDNHVEACQTLLNMCDTLELMSKPFDTLMRNYKDCLSLAKRSNDSKVEANILKNILRIQKAYGREDLAEETEQELNVIRCFQPESQDEEIETSDVEVTDEEIDLDELIGTYSDDDDEDPLNQDRRVRRRPTKSALTRKNEKGETPLHTASAKGNVSLIRSLVKQGHPVNIPDGAGWSPLHEACNHGQIEAAEVLIELGAKIDDRGGSECEGMTPLLDAASCGHLELITLLLDKGASPLAKTNKGDSVLDCLLACRERVIAEEGKLEDETQKEFDKVVKRLKECYDKVGQNYSSSSSKSTCARTQRSQAHSISGLQTRRIRTNESLSNAIDESRKRTECEVNNRSSGAVVDSAKEYKEAIQALRRRTKNETTYNEPLERVKKNALLAEEEVGDDWLEDDMRGMVQPAKRRKENFTGQQLRQPNIEKKPVKSPSPMLWDDDSEDVDDLFSSVVIPESQSNRRSSSPEIEFTSFSSPPRTEETRTALRSFLESSPSANFRQFRPATYSTQTSEERACSTSRPQQRQASLLAMNFQRCRAPNSSPRSSEEPSLHARPPPEQPQNAAAAATTASTPLPNVRAIKVRIGSKLFLVPIPQSGDSLTIGWLASEASRRYENSEGVMPVLKLTTVDGALLDSNDPLSIILNDNEVHGTATSWKSKPPSERYKEACSVANVGVDSYVEQKLEMCQSSGSLDIRDRRLPVGTLSPLFKAIQHCERLRDICLSSIFLSDVDFKTFVDHILTLTSVRSLDVSVNHITNDGLSHLAEVVSSGKFQVLNISYNPLGEGCSRSLCTLSQELLSLRTLNIRSVGLTSNFLHGNWFFEFNCLENLDIGYNKLDRESISKFLAALDADKIRSMNVSYAGSCEVAREVNLFLSRGRLENLEELSLAGLDVTDQDVQDLTESLLRASQLSKLNLASNPKITIESHQHLSRLKNLRELYLSGCALLPGHHELSLTLNKLTLSSETPISGFEEGLYNYYTNSIRL